MENTLGKTTVITEKRLEQERQRDEYQNALRAENGRLKNELSSAQAQLRKLNSHHDKLRHRMNVAHDSLLLFRDECGKGIKSETATTITIGHNDSVKTEVKRLYELILSATDLSSPFNAQPID